jgi:hypothetical protein
MMLSKIVSSWKEEDPKKWKLHENTVYKMIKNIKKTEDIVQISSNLELSICLSDNKILPEN